MKNLCVDKIRKCELFKQMLLKYFCRIKNSDLIANLKKEIYSFTCFSNSILLWRPVVADSVTYRPIRNWLTASHIKIRAECRRHHNDTFNSNIMKSNFMTGMSTY